MDMTAMVVALVVLVLVLLGSINDCWNLHYCENG